METSSSRRSRLEPRKISSICRSVSICSVPCSNRYTGKWDEWQRCTSWRERSPILLELPPIFFTNVRSTAADDDKSAAAFRQMCRNVYSFLRSIMYYHINWIWASNVWVHNERGCFNSVISRPNSLSTLNLHPAPSQLRGILIYLIRLVVLMQPYNVVISPLSEDCQVTTHL